ncbi:hypothetical protein [Sanguibacter inulinus]|uniref:Uncharacterized protein n=1 Tax=Sanguibacter inulinus TaxID=60922 RepID=A0A853F2C5_9MICO|nr:hypothetical protein [Sanguibacter inulinus]MBF0724458.1 hypothetical protein [Sanguibacter inulinus]NYS95603.1 hypothetical protein [Sanguibacter inulinus]
MNRSRRQRIVGFVSLAVELAIMIALIFLANRTGISSTEQAALYIGAGTCIVAAGVTANLVARARRRQKAEK